MRKFEVANGFENKGINLPIRATKNAAGYDFEAAKDILIKSVHTTDMGLTVEELLSGMPKYLKPTLVPTGIKADMEDDEALMLYNRSSNPKNGLILANGVGVVDSDYYSNPDNDGHIMFAFVNIGRKDYIVKKGDRIGQGVFQKFLLTDDDISVGTRISGFGSTGK